MDARFSPTLKDEISKIPFSCHEKERETKDAEITETLEANLWKSLYFPDLAKLNLKHPAPSPPIFLLQPTFRLFFRQFFLPLQSSFLRAQEEGGRRAWGGKVSAQIRERKGLPASNLPSSSITLHLCTTSSIWQVKQSHFLSRPV